MRVAEHVFFARVDAGAFLDRALSRYSAIQTMWRASLDIDRLLVRIGDRARAHSTRSVSHDIERRFNKARVALHEAIEASTRATARDTKWTSAMRRARRARGRK